MKENEIVFTKHNIDGLQFKCPPDETIFMISIADTGKAIVSWPHNGETRQQAYDVNDAIRYLIMNDWRPLEHPAHLPATGEEWREEFKQVLQASAWSAQIIPATIIRWVDENIFQPLQQENERLNRTLSESIQTGEKAIERIGELEEQLAEARGALRKISELKGETISQHLASSALK